MYCYVNKKELDTALIGVVVVSKQRVGDLPIVFIIKKHVKFQNLIMIHQRGNLLEV